MKPMTIEEARKILSVPFTTGVMRDDRARREAAIALVLASEAELRERARKVPHINRSEDPDDNGWTICVRDRHEDERETCARLGGACAFADLLGEGEKP